MKDMLIIFQEANSEMLKVAVVTLQSVCDRFRGGVKVDV